MNVIPTKLDGVYILEPRVFLDGRGFFVESYNKRVLTELGLDRDFVQDNHSLSEQPGTLRGLHYQLDPKAQTKLVRATAGSIFDVVVDIRRGSPTFGQWIGVELSAENKKQLLVPRGFAHGFCTLTANAEVQYKVDEYYSPEHDRGIRWDDPAIGITWPLQDVFLSDKDRKHPALSEAEINFSYIE